jgi:hypothetical protein
MFDMSFGKSTVDSFNDASIRLCDYMSKTHIKNILSSLQFTYKERLDYIVNFYQIRDVDAWNDNKSNSFTEETC